MKADLSFIGDIVRKTGNSAFLKIESEKTARAHEIGEQTGLFATPRVLRFDERKGILDLENMPGLTQMEALLHNGDARLAELIHKAGCALAVVHAELRLPDAMTVPPPAEWGANDVPRVALHGDFTLANLFLQRRTGRVVILDWSAAPILAKPIALGPVWFDIQWFLYYMFQSMPLKPVRGLEANALGTAFCDGYYSSDKLGTTATALEKGRDQIRSVLRALVAYRMAERPWYKKMPFLARQALAYLKWRRFVLEPRN